VTDISTAAYRAIAVWRAGHLPARRRLTWCAVAWFGVVGVLAGRRIKVDPSKNKDRVTLHDPCNLVRWGGISEPQRRIRVFPRSSVRWQARWFPSPDGQERIGVIDSGINIIIDQLGGFDTVDISTDRLVIWTPSQQLLDLSGEGAPTGEVPLEFYMEGNIVFRQADRVIYADRMYYNVQGEYGVVLNGEMLTPIPQYEGLVRLKAEVLRQVDQNHFEGFNAAVSTSRLGVPGYWLQSGSFQYEDLPIRLSAPPSNDPLADPPRSESRKHVTSRHNQVYLAGFPIFWWPFMSADLDRPTYYLESISINSDRVFGTQVLTDWNLYQLFGFHRAPAGSDWTGSVDYLSERGWGLGTNFRYERDSWLGRPGRVYGFLDAWGIDDEGLDNLGRGRRNLIPEQNPRGRILGRHRSRWGAGNQLTGELGLISDRNFLEQYYEEEWDEEKDQTTGIEFKRTLENHSWSISADGRANDFFTQTEWLPRFDHFWLGQPLLSNWLVWNEHTNVGYAKLRTLTEPLNPQQLAAQNPLAWEEDFDQQWEGLRAASRQELSLPLEWGPAKVVPYVSGEAAYWRETLARNELTRLLGQAGLRTSIPFWRANPAVRNVLLNLNGLAHKVVLEADLFWSDADANFEELPLYDPLDDDSIEYFRRSFCTYSFDCGPDGQIPLRFDERFYALRSGLQRWVTSPSTEIADDLAAIRLAARQRWQTKRGLPGQQRVVDWITLDLESLVYPDPDRDNFGEPLGLAAYDFRWHLGDRFTILSDGQVDFFTDGLRTVSVAGMVTRPGQLRYLFGARSIEGPISSSLLYGSTSCRLSPKWIINYGSTLDLGSTGNIGQRGQIIRVGESFLVGLGFNYDASRDNFGVHFGIEPRFLPGRLSRVGGMPIPPVGVAGLE